jgi:tetratricopeptide (TPR) repeat protein
LFAPLALLFALVTPSLPWIEDSYPQALEQAKSRHLPLFVEVWAPWCHTCRFMRANVLNDPTLLKQAGQFVWLAIDSDKPVNAAFTEKFATGGVPLFVLIDPESGRSALSWYGTATAPQLLRLMEDGRRAIAGGLSGADAWLARADRLNSEKKPAEAAKFYDQALQAGGPDWTHRTRAIESLVMAYAFSRNTAACAETAVKEAPSMARDRSFVNTVYFGLDCSTPGSPQLTEMEKLAEEGVQLHGVLGDDTSALYEQLANLYRRDQNEEAATRTATAWLQYLQQHIAKAPNAEGRLGYDFHLVNASLFLHKPELALPEVEQAERDLPGEYNPARLAARLYDALGRPDDAIAAADRCLRKAYGAPKLTAFATKARLQQKKGDLDGARKTYAEGIEFGKTLPDAIAEKHVAALQKALEGI